MPLCNQEAAATEAAEKQAATEAREAAEEKAAAAAAAAATALKEAEVGTLHSHHANRIPILSIILHCNTYHFQISVDQQDEQDSQD